LTLLQIASMVPSVLTCLIGRTLGSGIGSLDHFDLRDLAASLLAHLCRKYSKSSKTLKPRLARSCLKNFLDPKKPFGTHYGAILGLNAAGGPDAVRMLIVPNLKEYESVIRDEFSSSATRQAEAEKVLAAIFNVLGSLVEAGLPVMNGYTEEDVAEMRSKLTESIGDVLGNRIADSGHIQLTKAVLECFRG
jgi:transcription initiation factor TFIID subunit 6